MAKYQAYAEYKDSGVEWLGQVPTHWDIKRIKETAQIINGYPFDSGKFDPVNGTPLVRIRDINSNETQIFFNGFVPKEALIFNSDILIGMDGDFNVCEWKGGDAALNQRVCCLRSNDKYLTKFLAYLLPARMKIINDLTYFTTVKHLSSTDVLKTVYAIPNKIEYVNIVKFLDHETSKIDHLIEKQQQLIELLKEKRQAVISHAVTKGLDPNVQMKDSGVEWLGEVPEHWDTTKIKYVAELTPKKSEVSSNDNRLCTFVPMEKLKLGSLIKDEEKPISEVIGGYTYFKNGDLLLAKVTPCFENKNMVVASDLKNGIGFGSSEIYVLRANHKVNTQFLYYRLQEDQFMELGTGAMTGAGGLKRVPSEFLNNFEFALPPLSEQIAITKYLNQYLIKNEYLMNKAQSAIQLMQERRTALISAAVTGKIDVRHWQTPNVAEADTELSA